MIPGKGNRHCFIVTQFSNDLAMENDLARHPSDPRDSAGQKRFGTIDVNFGHIVLRRDRTAFALRVHKLSFTSSLPTYPKAGKSGRAVSKPATSFQNGCQFPSGAALEDEQPHS
jgi:hypothetical protein